MRGGGFCTIQLDSTLLPAGDNVWNVDFHFRNDAFAGRAVLRGGVLYLTARISDRNSSGDLDVRWTWNANKDRLDYTRDYNSFGSYSRVDAQLRLHRGLIRLDSALNRHNDLCGQGFAQGEGPVAIGRLNLLL